MGYGRLRLFWREATRQQLASENSFPRQGNRGQEYIPGNPAGWGMEDGGPAGLGIQAVFVAAVGVSPCLGH